MNQNFKSIILPGGNGHLPDHLLFNEINYIGSHNAACSNVNYLKYNIKIQSNRKIKEIWVDISLIEVHDNIINTSSWGQIL